MTQWGLDTLFNPAKRHMDEEKRRLQSTRAEQGDSSGGKRIDLESGKVTIRRADADDETAAGAVDVVDRKTAKKKSGRRGDGEPSAAAIRAAKRRGRQL
jgi:uncharacterized protein DUF6191